MGLKGHLRPGPNRKRRSMQGAKPVMDLPKLWMYIIWITRGFTVQKLQYPHLRHNLDHEEVLPQLKGLTVSTLQYKCRSTSRYSLAEIMVIEAFIQIMQRINLSIGVRVAGTPSKYFYCDCYLQKEFIILHEAGLCHLIENCLNIKVDLYSLIPIVRYVPNPTRDIQGCQFFILSANSIWS
jgi:hypothetical protein